MTAVVEQVEILDLRAAAGPGDHGFFVGVRANGCVGWYGPVAAKVARFAATTLTNAVRGTPVADHRTLLQRLHARALPYLVSTDRRTVSRAVGALDCALWDLDGHLTGQPVAHLLSSRPVDSVAAYAAWLSLDLTAPSAEEVITRVARDGWPFTKWGLRRIPGSGAGSDAAAALRAVAEQVAQLAGGRAAFDAVRTWDTALTREFARPDLAWLLWLEDPLPDEFDAQYRQLASAELPLALGERVLLDEDPRPLFTLLGLRAFTVDVLGCGGLTRALDLINTARTHRIDVIPHGRSLIPALHLAAAHPDVVPCVEYQLPWEPRRQTLYTETRAPKNGRIALGQTPGLGCTPRSHHAR